MSSGSLLATYRRLREQPLWRLLASDNAPMVLGLLEAQMYETGKAVPASLLFDRLERDIEVLRASGEDLPRTARAYVSDWLASGWLERRFPPGASEEAYELSAAETAAIRFAGSLDQRRAMATEGRLALVIEALRSLAEETDRDKFRRLERLRDEQERLDAEIAAIERGQIRVLPEARALERVREIIALSDELIGDFRRVRDDFNRLNRDLRATLIDQEGSRGDVLEALFAGIDLIGRSEAGQTFQAFWRLLTDPRQSTTLDGSLEAVMERDFIARLEPQQRRFLRRVPDALLEQGGAVHDVLGHFARSLKTFVQSREFLEQRRIHRLVQEAQRAALDVREAIRPTQIVQELALTSSRVRSLSQWVLHDPALAAPAGGMTDGEPAPIDLETVGELVAQSEIDFAELKAQVRQLLASTTQVSIAEVLAAFPPRQGLGSIIGLIALASRHGISGTGQQTVAWTGADGTIRQARIPTLYFLHERLDELN